MSLLLLLVMVSRVGAAATTALSAAECVEPCILDMQEALEGTPLLGGMNSAASSSPSTNRLSWSQLTAATSDQRATRHAFQLICDSYRRVDACLASCERAADAGTATRLRHTYAGLRFICVQHRQEFFDSLPCLARWEPVAMGECGGAVNASLSASNAFSAAVIERAHHVLRARFDLLCQALTAMVDCVAPVTRSGCGDAATKMMLRFISVGFASFEQLYGQLGIADQLPASCRSLLGSTTSLQQHPARRDFGSSHHRLYNHHATAPPSASLLLLSFLSTLMLCTGSPRKR